MSQQGFYQLWRRNNAHVLNDRAEFEHGQHRIDRPLCHQSKNDVGLCRCDCGGLYHGGRLPRYSAEPYAEEE